MTISPNNPSLRTVYLHASPLLQINNVTLSSPTPTNPLLPTPASFSLTNPFQPLPDREPPIDLKSHQEIKRKTWAALGERDEGELAISVSHGWVRLLQTEGADGASAVTLAPIHIQIDYQLIVGGDVVEGIVFRRPGDGGDDSVGLCTRAMLILSKCRICSCPRQPTTQLVYGLRVWTTSGSAARGNWSLSYLVTCRVESRMVMRMPSR